MLLGRNIPVASLFGAGLTLVRSLPRLALVKRPLSVLWNYIRKTSPEYVELRSGHRVYFSSHPDDIVSFYLVFIKKEYGEVHKGDVVFDIGANIGCFAVCAALSGAKTVHAFEPSREAFSVLLKNIHANKLDSIIVPVNKAVSDHSGEIVRFPHKASPFNSLVMTAGPESKLHVDRFTGDLREHALAMSASLEIEFNEIETVALGDYMSEQGVPSIDLLKMDCEGAEYSIVPSLSKETIDRIVSIRMECHGDSKALMDSFCHDAYMVERASGDELWLLKRHDALSS
ncbi:MAG: FkbM family methyltransferase [Terracidiphilus sp.]